MPIEQVSNYETQIREYLASEYENEGEKKSVLDSDNNLTKAQLQRACGVKYRVRNPDFVTGPEIVVKSLRGDPLEIRKFIISWRKHFVTTVRPRFMPTGWSVDNPVVSGRDNFVILKPQLKKKK